MKKYRVTTNEIEWLGVYWDDIITYHKDHITVGYLDPCMELRKQYNLSLPVFEAILKYHMDWIIEVADPKFTRDDMIEFAQYYSHEKIPMLNSEVLNNWLKQRNQ